MNEEKKVNIVKQIYMIFIIGIVSFSLIKLSFHVNSKIFFNLLTFIFLLSGYIDIKKRTKISTIYGICASIIFIISRDFNSLLFYIKHVLPKLYMVIRGYGIFYLFDIILIIIAIFLLINCIKLNKIIKNTD